MRKYDGGGLELGEVDSPRLHQNKWTESVATKPDYYSRLLTTSGVGVDEVMFVAGNDASLADLYKGWDRYEQLLATAVAPLTPEQLGLRAAPRLRTIERITAHIIGARVRWFHRAMGEGESGIASLGAWDRHGRRTPTRDELVQGLGASWRVIQQCLEHWTLADLGQTYEGEPAYGEPPVLTRQWIIWHVLEHDFHHGGESSLTLGIHRLAAPFY